MKNLTTPKDCCLTSVREDGTSRFCLDCGSPLVRCMAFAECGGLIGEDGLCTVCVDPHLVIVPGATMNAPVGGAVALPFELLNNSRVGRPLFVTGLWSREGGDWRQERLGWEKLDPGRRAAASVVACELDKAGLHEVEIMLAVATRWKAREESFVLSTRVLLNIAGDKEKAGTQIQISSDNQMNGNVIQIHEHEKKPGEDGRVIEAIDMNMTRLDLEERRLGFRGKGTDSYVPNSAIFRFDGFASGDAPTPGLPIATPDAVLAFGRGDTRDDGGVCDVRILLHGSDGAVDEGRSELISRLHFEFYNENDRLKLRVAGRNGLRVNGEALGKDEVVVIGDGDRIAPLASNPGDLELTVAFRRELNRVAEVTIARNPPVQGAAH